MGLARRNIGLHGVGWEGVACDIGGKVPPFAHSSMAVDVVDGSGGPRRWVSVLWRGLAIFLSLRVECSTSLSRSYVGLLGGFLSRSLCLLVLSCGCGCCSTKLLFYLNTQHMHHKPLKKKEKVDWGNPFARQMAVKMWCEHCSLSHTHSLSLTHTQSNAGVVWDMSWETTGYF
jgi:hypothetical protein